MLVQAKSITPFITNQAKNTYIEDIGLSDGNVYKPINNNYLELLANYANSENTSELHMPYHNYAGPGTHTVSRLLKGDMPVSYIDKAALVHDIEYLKPGNKAIADVNMYRNLMKQRPELFVLNTLIYDALLLSTPFMSIKTNQEVYIAAKKYAINKYKLQDYFAD
jgi:hypothetical protein